VFQYHFSQERTVLECAALVRNIEFTLKGIIPSEVVGTLPPKRNERKLFVIDPLKTNCDDIKTLDEVKKEAVLNAAFCLKGNLMQVADALQMSRASLYRSLVKYGWKSDRVWARSK